jgi:hypothetical protein
VNGPTDALWRPSADRYWLAGSVPHRRDTLSR